MPKFEIIDKTLHTLRFITEGVWIECYLNHNTLAPKDFTVVESTGAGVDACTLTEFDDLVDAQAFYSDVVQRTKARIADALTNV